MDRDGAPFDEIAFVLSQHLLNVSLAHLHIVLLVEKALEVARLLSQITEVDYLLVQVLLLTVWLRGLLKDRL